MRFYTKNDGLSTDLFGFYAKNDGSSSENDGISAENDEFCAEKLADFSGGRIVGIAKGAGM